jgi:hypothetical protein
MSEALPASKRKVRRQLALGIQSVELDQEARPQAGLKYLVTSRFKKSLQPLAMKVLNHSYDLPMLLENLGRRAATRTVTKFVTLGKKIKRYWRHFKEVRIGRLKGEQARYTA